MSNPFLVVAGSVYLALFPISLFAFQEDAPLSAAEIGREIAVEQKRRDKGWGDNVADTTMILRNAAGKESLRRFRSMTLEEPMGGDLSLGIFDTPNDIKGTAFLTHAHITEPDEQWLYLPATKRIKHINSSSRSRPFMGSEFSYEDMVSFEVEKYTYRYVDKVEFAGESTLVVESYPIDENAGYSHRVSWIDAGDYVVRKIDFYDRRKKLLKTLLCEDYAIYAGKYWRASTFRMSNHQTGKSTELHSQNIRFGTGLSRSDFQKNALKRAR